jgi:uncharacterized protein (DUF1015 family)
LLLCCLEPIVLPNQAIPNVKIHPFPAAFPREECLDEEFFRRAKEFYRSYWEEGCFAEEAAAMYVYQITENDRQRTGLLAAVSMEDYRQGRVKRHEHTLGPKEQQQLALLIQRRASVKPVLLAHQHHQPLVDWLLNFAQAQPATREVPFPEEGSWHRFWAITGRHDITWLQDFFRRHIPALYIADGHHRFSSAARLYERLRGTPRGKQYHSLMGALFPTTALDIHNFNRVVAYDLPATPLALMARLSAWAEVEPIAGPAAPTRRHELTFCLEGEWFKMHWHPAVMAKQAEAGLPVLDVSLLNRCILQDTMAMTDVRNDQRISYLEGPRGLAPLERKADRKDGVAFCLHPLSWEAFFRVIDHGQVLPPKSTWFQPRMKNGLIVQPFHD